MHYGLDGSAAQLCVLAAALWGFRPTLHITVGLVALCSFVPGTLDFTSCQACEQQQQFAVAGEEAWPQELLWLSCGCLEQTKSQQGLRHALH